jgi:prevent-host-death family protein
MSSQKSTPVTIPATEVRRNLGNILKRTFTGREHFIIEREGFPVAVLLSMQEYDDLMKDHEEREKQRENRRREFHELVRPFGEEVERQGLTEEDIDRIVEETRQRLYEEKHGRKPAK